MPLSAAVPALTSGIKAAYDKAKSNGMQEGVSPDALIDTLGDGFGQAVHDFMLQALVTTNDIAEPGQNVIPAAAVTATPGSGTGTGNLV